MAERRDGLVALGDAGGEEALSAAPGSGLGILRSAAGQNSGGFSRLPARARAKARERRVLVLTKANSRATVHRPAYLDYVVVAAVVVFVGWFLYRKFSGRMDRPARAGAHLPPDPRDEDR